MHCAPSVCIFVQRWLDSYIAIVGVCCASERVLCVGTRLEQISISQQRLLQGKAMRAVPAVPCSDFSEVHDPAVIWSDLVRGSNKPKATYMSNHMNIHTCWSTC